MKGSRILGMIVVMAMVLTAIPAMAGHAKASSRNSSDNLPNYLVFVRNIPEPNYVKEIQKTIGNKYQNDKFGVALVVHVLDYEYDPNAYDTIKVYPVAFGVKGENAGDYQIEAMEISVTKGTLESMDSRGFDTKVTGIPYDTDYDAEVLAHDENTAVGVGKTKDQSVEWLKIISNAVIKGVTKLVPHGKFMGTPLTVMVDMAIDRYLYDPSGLEYDGSGRDPWSSLTPDYEKHTFEALKAVSSGNDVNKALLGQSIEWNLYDDIRNVHKIHTLEIRATLWYGIYHSFMGVHWWTDEHKISTEVTIFAVPSASSDTRGSDDAGNGYDPIYGFQYDHEITIDGGRTHYSGTEISDTDTSPSHRGSIYSGDAYGYNNEYFYVYRGFMPIGDSQDNYRTALSYMSDYDENEVHVRIYSTGNIKIKVFNNIVIHIKDVNAGTPVELTFLIHKSQSIYIDILRDRCDTPVNYFFSVYVYHYNDNSGSSGGGSGGGSSGGLPGHGDGGIHITSVPPAPVYGDVTASNGLPP